MVGLGSSLKLLRQRTHTLTLTLTQSCKCNRSETFFIGWELSWTPPTNRNSFCQPIPPATLAGFRWAAVVITAITVGWLMTSANGVLHKVGGAKGWNQNVNYTEWSANENFYRYYNVLEVNKSSFESCNDQGFMKNITRGGRDVYQLTEDRPYYFLSGGGYCFHGMRLALVALQDQQQLLLLQHLPHLQMLLLLIPYPQLKCSYFYPPL
ncbi:early nodulin-like protein 20 [Prunus dulcis]|uniref:Early nodulin-like protein 20 n=1 Tax=Prunus dulcis TaxID=3755 RepID=A0A4Y1R8L3_PRUDU|nr:early nodulin-like protein 20 [Prunus dulcis]